MPILRKICVCSCVLCSIFIVLVSCSKEKNDDSVLIEGDYRESTHSADGTTVGVKTAVMGTFSPGLSSALNLRFTNQSPTVDESTMVLIIQGNLVTDKSSDMSAVYKNGGTIIVAKPVSNLLAIWAKKESINLVFDSSIDSCGIYAFCRNDSMAIKEITDSTANDYLNNLISWVNVNQIPILQSGQDDYTGKDIEMLFDAQIIRHQIKLELDEEEAHVALSNPDRIKGTGSIDATYKIYPLYAFEGQAGSGDYYLVCATYTIHCADMYRGNYTSRHGGVLVRLCGFYMEDFGISTYLTVNGSDVPVGQFSVGFTPTPKTTVGKTTYSDACSWNLEAKVSGEIGTKGGKAGFSVGGGVSFTSGQSRTVSDINIMNNWQDGKATYDYVVNPLLLPDYLAKVAISNPPDVSFSTLTYYSSWVWHIPDMKDGDNSKVFNINTVAIPVFGSCHFYTTRADFTTHHWKNAAKQSVSTPVIPPCRTPSGRAILTSRFNSDTYITDITIHKSGSSDIFYSSTDSYIKSQPFEIDLPVGNYTMEFKAGKDKNNLKSYSMGSGYFSIKHTEKTHLYTDFDFKEL